MDSPQDTPDKIGFYSPPQSESRQTEEKKPSWFESWFTSEEEPGPARTIDEFLSLERPG
jgi:hypothetical protein